MKKEKLVLNKGFNVVLTNDSAQCAEMVLDANESTGGPDNKHEHSDQWMYVLDGNGKAIIEGKELNIQRGDLILIESGETHEIKNTREKPLSTINFYVPPEY